MIETETKWIPLFRDDLQEDYRRVVANIAESILHKQELYPRFLGRELCESIAPSLADGYAGLAIMYGYLSASLEKREYADYALNYLDKAFVAASRIPLPPGLFSGFSGVAWTAEILKKAGILCENHLDGDINREIDDALLALLTQPRRITNYDIISGLVGIGMYFVERMPSRKASQALGLIIEQIREMSQKMPEGVAWYTSPNHLSDLVRSRYPSGVYDLGLAHGLSGLLSYFCLLIENGSNSVLLKELLEDGTRWFVSRSIEGSADTIFPRVYDPSGVHRFEPSGLAWCYGDLGAITALLRSEKCTHGKPNTDEAIRMAGRVARRALSTNRFSDPCLCHGNAGVAHIFNRLYQATGEALLASAARHCFKILLNCTARGQGLAGVKSRYQIGELPKYWRMNPGILNGAAGVALSIASAISTVPPFWDRMLLLDVPTRAFSS